MSRIHNKYPLAIHIFFLDGDKVLLSLRENTGYEDGKYSVVAGHVEAGESIIEAGIREAKEEVGVSITPYHFRIVGSMHRKSDDERIDYFAVVEHWSGEIKNCEENKCGGLHWYPISELPYNVIPYIKTALTKTFIEKKVLWYEEFGWNTYHELEEMYKHHILMKRGIITEDNNLDNVYNFILDTIRSIDCKFKDNGNREKWINELRSLMLLNKILIGTPILQNLKGKSTGVLSACTTITPPTNEKGEIVYWELERILETELKLGMGVGIDLSLFPDPDKAIKKIDEILLRIDNSLKEANRRPVAVILTLKGDHPRILEFIKSRACKNELTTRLNISVLIDGEIPKGDLEDGIINAINTCGEPGIIFPDRFEKENDTPQWRYNSTAPCAEIAMPDGDACHFSYLNVSAFITFNENECKYEFDKDGFISAIYTIVRFLDDIVEYTLINSPKGKYELVRKKRRIGVGIAGLATALLKIGIAYNSNEGLNFARSIAHILAIHTKKASIELAKERSPFPAYEVSRYKDVDWLTKKLSLLGKECDSIIHDLQAYGIRNATTLAFPPTGTSSQIAGVSPSFEPYLNFALKYKGHKCIPSIIYDYIYKRYSKEDAGELVSQLMRDEVSIEKFPEFISATQIDVDTQLI
ncbi:MAG: NUDIX domain-containing protein, partial [Bacteroidaceae bacterium]|nr:NUDIX domain-containing protein [Bacteroidaceae bacterium]